MTIKIRRVVLPMLQGSASPATHDAALIHALGIGLAAAADVLVVHGTDDASAGLGDRAVELLAAWGHIHPGGTPADAGIQLIQVTAGSAGHLRGVVGSAGAAAGDLLLLTLSRRLGFQQLRQGGVEHDLARAFRGPTLFLPEDARALVDIHSGEVCLRRCLVPVGDAAEGERGLAAARAVAREIEGSDPVVDLLYVGDPEMPFPRVGAVEDVAVQWRRREGSVVGGILAEATQARTDLVIMPTRQHDSLLDLLWGSRTERVAASAPCPVLAVPPFGTTPVA